MRVSEIISMAFSNLWRRKLRTALTVAAVVIGATLVALMASLGTGLKDFIVGQFGQTFPEDAIIVSSGRDIDVFPRGGGPQEINTLETVVVLPFTSADVAKLRAVPGVERVDYLVGVSARYIQPEGSGKIFTVNVDGVPEYEAVEGMGFNALTAEDILAEINGVFNVIQVGLSAFGIIALVVAAIGIINTLLMAIHERTREIGVMKAVGATRGNIRMLFTTEGAALGFLGGAVGGLLALFLGQAINVIGARTFLSDFPGFELSSFTWWLIPGVITLTTAISLLAGLYPANRAARLDPVEALRYE